MDSDPYSHKPEVEVLFNLNITHPSTPPKKKKKKILLIEEGEERIQVYPNP